MTKDERFSFLLRALLLIVILITAIKIERQQTKDNTTNSVRTLQALTQTSHSSNANTNDPPLDNVVEERKAPLLLPEFLSRSRNSEAARETFRVVVAIVSSCTEDGAKRRDAIRKSWVQFAPSTRSIHGGGVAWFFVVGSPTCLLSSYRQHHHSKDDNHDDKKKKNLCSKSESEIEQSIREESEKHGDLLQLSVGDRYEDLTSKTLALLQWLATPAYPDGLRIPNSQFDYVIAAKTDDDVYVRLHEVVAELEGLGEYVKMFWSGFVWRNAKPDRRTGSRFKNAERSFESDVFPPYCSGHFYLLSRDVISLLGSEESSSTFMAPLRLYRNEDVSLGVWLRPFKIDPVHNPRFISIAGVCSPLMLSRHYTKPADMVRFYENDIAGKHLCHGMSSSWEISGTCPIGLPCLDHNVIPGRLHNNSRRHHPPSECREEVGRVQ